MKLADEAMYDDKTNYYKEHERRHIKEEQSEK